MGLVDEVVAPEAVLDGPSTGPSTLAAGAAAAQGLAKRAIDRGLDITLNGGLDLEQQLFADVFRTEDAADRRPVVPGVRSGPRHLHRHLGPGDASQLARLTSARMGGHDPHVTP